MADADNKNIGKRAKLIRRDLNGQNTLLTGVIVGETDLNWTIKTDRGETRTEPKLFCSVEWGA